jgi:hypothetical protein
MRVLQEAQRDLPDTATLADALEVVDIDGMDYDPESSLEDTIQDLCVLDLLDQMRTRKAS